MLPYGIITVYIHLKNVYYFYYQTYNGCHGNYIVDTAYQFHIRQHVAC